MPKANRTATLVRYAKIEGLGWRRGSLVKSKNGRVKPDIMGVNGVECPIPSDSHYQIRHYQRTKTVYTTVGSDYDAAHAILDKFRASRQLEAAHAALGIAVPEKKVAPKTLAEQCDAYLAKKRALGLVRRSMHIYDATLPAFVAHCGRAYAVDVTENDVVCFMDSVKREGFIPDLIHGKRRETASAERQAYSQKSLSMRYVALRGFLRNCSVQVEKLIEPSTHKRLAAKPEQDTNPYP